MLILHTLTHRLWLAAQDVVAAWRRIFYVGAVVWVLLLTPATYRWRSLRHILRAMYLMTAPVLGGYTLLAALVCLVLTRIVVVTAHSYGLSNYALEMVVRVLVLELIPLGAALFVAMRCTIPESGTIAAQRHSGAWQARRARGANLLHAEVLPRVVAGMYACLTLAALSCMVSLVTAYLAVYGLTLAGVDAYTRLFGRIFNPSVTLVFVLKTWLFSLAVAIIPVAAALHMTRRAARARAARAAPSATAPARPDGRPAALARMFAILLLIELLSLVGNYY